MGVKEFGDVECFRICGQRLKLNSVWIESVLPYPPLAMEIGTSDSIYAGTDCSFHSVSRGCSGCCYLFYLLPANCFIHRNSNSMDHRWSGKICRIHGDSSGSLHTIYSSGRNRVWSHVTKSCDHPAAVFFVCNTCAEVQRSFGRSPSASTAVESWSMKTIWVK